MGKEGGVSVNGENSKHLYISAEQSPPWNTAEDYPHLGQSVPSDATTYQERLALFSVADSSIADCYPAASLDWLLRRSEP